MKLKTAVRHAELGEGFYDPVEPARFPAHILRYRNQRAAASVGLGDLTDDQWVDHGHIEPGESLRQGLCLDGRATLERGVSQSFLQSFRQVQA